jgi:hypothetical protein
VTRGVAGDTRWVGRDIPHNRPKRGILEVMNDPSGSRPKHLRSSPFAAAPEVVAKTFEADERVSHDLYGLGKVLSVDSHAVTVDFGSQTLRIAPPFAKLHHL